MIDKKDKIPVKVKNANYGFTNYEMNQQAVAATKALTAEEIEEGRQLIESFISNEYYMLLCKEFTDFTIFVGQKVLSNAKKYSLEILETASNRGTIKSINFDNEENPYGIEIWVEVDGIPHMYILFDYTDGIVRV